MPFATSLKTLPPRKPGLSPRRLLARLEDEAAVLCWVSGPPGCGKTTLAAHHAEAGRRPCIWLRLDEEDADPAELLANFRQACGVELPRCAEALPRLSRDHLGNLATFVGRYCRAVFEMAGAPLIVLDDAHTLSGADALRSFLEALLRHAPPSARLIVLGREPAPEFLGRALVQGEAMEIRADELSLSQAETAELLAALDVTLAAPEIDRLFELTGGWAAGVVLCARSWPPRVTRGGEWLSLPAHCEAYLASEVFERLPEDERRLATTLCWLPEIDEPLLRLLGAAEQASAFLRRLSQEGIFVEQAARAELAYRFHPLFAEFLRKRAQGLLSAAELDQVQRRAAHALASVGRHGAAIELWLQCGGVEEAVSLIKAQARELLSRAGNGTLMQWLGRLPETVFEQEPWLRYWRGVVRMHGAPRDAREDLVEAVHQFKATDDLGGWMLGLGQLGCSRFTEWGGAAIAGMPEVELSAMDAEYDGMPPDTQAAFALASWMNLCNACPDHPRLPAWEDRIRRLMQLDIDASLKLRLGWMLALYYAFNGSPASLISLCGLLADAERARDVEPHARLQWYLIRIVSAWSSGDFDAIRPWHDEAMRYSRDSGVHLLVVFIHCLSALGLLLAGDEHTCGRLLDKAARRLSPNRPMEVWATHVVKAWHALTRGDGARAIGCARIALDAADLMSAPVFRGMALVSLAAAALQDGRRQEFTAHIVALRACAARSGGPLLSLHVGLLEASARAAEGSADYGEALRSAFAHGRSHGLVHFFGACPAMLSRLCADALRFGIEPAHASALVRAYRLTPPSDARRLERWPWPLRISTLGCWRIVLDGQVLTFEGKAPQRPLAVLKVLISLGGEGVAVHRIADELWPDAEGDGAKRAFETALHRLRKILRLPHALVLQEGRLSLNRQICRVDLDDLDACVERIFHAPERTPADLARALGKLDRGEYLPDEELPVVVACRARVAAQLARARGCLAERSATAQLADGHVDR
ncbi:MAG: AAA family ATPase [Rhodocyclaceae bacterium]|nr:AAA family ATPase [Rhodocyclaceae bacterium]